MNRLAVINTCYSRLALRAAKAECRELGIRIPRMQTYKSSLHRGHFEVWADTGPKTPVSQSEGWYKATDAYYAKAEYLMSLIIRRERSLS